MTAYREWQIAVVTALRKRGVACVVPNISESTWKRWYAQANALDTDVTHAEAYLHNLRREADRRRARTQQNTYGR